VPKRQQRIADQQRIAELKRNWPKLSDPHGVRRAVALMFNFYSCCGNSGCRRAKKCIGAEAPCFNILWPEVPEIQKDFFRAMIEARRTGATTVAEIEAFAFAKIMAHYTPEQIMEASAHAGRHGWGPVGPRAGAPPTARSVTISNRV
jgi:hypothetical protein